jgi:calcineurin-like phosphoesterase family protein
MARWYTADLHLGHANIIRYCDRPFSDVDEMNRALIDRWNSVVADDDEVWVLGDVALGPIAQSLALIDELHGDKVLVPPPENGRRRIELQVSLRSFLARPPRLAT